jgi:hypothetical protein
MCFASNIKGGDIMKRYIQLTGIFVLVMFSLGLAQAAVRDPVAVLFKVEGSVEYQKPQKKWKKARRNKFLFAGYQVRTGADGSGRITVKKSGETVSLGANALVAITDAGIETKKGEVSEEAKSGALASALIKKFSKPQSYTTVRRAKKSTDVSINAAREFILSKTFPEIVWENSGKEYSYRVTIGGEAYDVPATTDPVARLRVNPFSGSKKLGIDVIKDKETIISLEPYRRRGKVNDHMVSWLDEGKEADLQKSIADLKTAYPDNSFILGSLLDRKKMWVAAMDSYKMYLDGNPDEIEMSPYLFKVYKRLMFTNLYLEELAKWNKAMSE